MYKNLIKTKVRENLPRNSGVYFIINDVNNKIYIGSSIDIRKRIMGHFSYLRSNNHRNSLLQNSYNFYTENEFSFGVLCECDINDMISMEQYYIDLYDSTNKKIGFNLCKVAGIGCWLGLKHKPESIEKMRKTLQDGRRKGRNNSQWGKTGTRKGVKYSFKEMENLKNRGIVGLFVCNETGQIYYRILDAVHDLGVQSKAVRGCLYGKRKSTHKYTFRFLTDV